MKRLIFLIFLILPLQGLSYALEVYPDTIDLGKVKKYTSKKRYLKILNDTQKRVEIIGIVNACGLALKVDKKFFLPGEFEEAELFFDSGAPQGAFEEKVTVIYKEDGMINEKKIKVSWYTYPDKYPEVIMFVDEINLGDILPKTPKEFEFEIMNAGNMVLTVTANVLEGVLINLPVDINPGEKRRIKGKIVAENVGIGEKKLLLETNDLNNPKIILPIKYNAKWDVDRSIKINIEKAIKTEKGYEIPISIFSPEHIVQLVSIEDINGKKLLIHKKPEVLFNKEKGQWVIILSEKEFEDLKKSFLYILLGVDIN